MDEVRVSILTNADGTNKSFKELQKTSKSLKNELAGLEEGTKEYNKTLNDLALTQGKLNKINRDARNATANLTDVYAGLTRSVAGVASGFQVATSAMTLFGVENENLASTIARLQSFQGIVQGLYGVSNGIKNLNNLVPRLRIAFSALNKVMLANPALILGGALAGLGAIFVGVTANIKTNRDEVEKANESYNTYKSTINDLERETEYYIRVLKAQGVSEAEIIQARIDNNNKLLDESLSAIQGLFEGYDREWQNLYENIDNYRDEDARKLILNFRFIKGVTQEQLNGLFDDYFRFYDNVGKLTDDANIEEIRSNKRASEDLDRQRKTAYEKQQAELQKQREKEIADEEAYNANRLKTEQFFLDQYTDSLQGQERLDYIQSEIELNAVLAQHAKERADSAVSFEERSRAQERYLELLQQQVRLEQEEEEIQETIRLAQQEVDEAEALRILQQIDLENQLYLAKNPENLSFAEQLQRYEDEANAAWALAEDESASYEERIAAIQAYNQANLNKAKLDKELADNKRKIEQASLNASKQYLDSAAKLLGEETAAGKATAVASATISTYQSANSAYASLAGIPVVGPALAAAAAGSAIAAGFANIKEILKVNVPGANDTTSGQVTTSSVPTMPDIDTSAFETYTQIDADDLDILNQQKVVLVVEDVNQAQKRVQVAETGASF